MAKTNNATYENTEATIPPQEWTKYNRDSGNKTRYFVGVLLILVAALSFYVLYLFINS